MKFVLKVILLFLAIAVTGTFLVVEAKEEPKIPYSVTPIVNAHQTNSSLGYFDLQVNAGTKETVAISVSNHSEKEITVRITPNTAKTSINGTIDYSGASLKNTKKLVASFEKITSGEQLLTIPPKSIKEASFSIDIPKQAFKGVLLGGFYIKEEKKSDKEEKGDGTNVAIKNEFSFIIGCQLKITDEPVKKTFYIDDVHIDTYGGYFSVVTEIVNDAPALVSSFSLDGKISDMNGKKLYTLRKDSFSMAPNSIFSFPEKVEQSLLKPGSYTMNMVITSQNGKKTWSIDKKFVVTSKERATVLKESIEKLEKTNLLLYVGLGIIVLLLLLLIVVLMKKKK